MENPNTGTRTNIPLGGEYEVFLNFRGCDIRYVFADALYHFLDDAQIRIFMDDAEIQVGEIIGDEILRAIDNSKFYIPIFSSNYASSHWCLIELTRMMENVSKSKDENKKVILPIFYDVEPEELKLPEKSSYRDAILKLELKKVNQEKKFSTKDVDRWRTALREVDDSKGWKLRDHLGIGRLSTLVVEEVLKRLGIKRRRVTKDLVGMKDQIVALNNLLGIRFGNDSSDGNDSSEYGVFFSFRGPDVRHGIVDVLKCKLIEAGIPVFIDDSSERSLIQVINCRLYIPFFTKNYVSSSICLRELEKMAEDTFNPKDGNKKMILPIFYRVKPRDVMLKLKEQGFKDLKMSRQALGVKGFVRDDYKSEWDLIQSVVSEVTHVLQKERRKVTTDLDVRLVGIYGMTGIGKSTLVKIIFNQWYPHFKKYCSFLDDVSETAKAKDLVKLQKQLLSDMFNSKVAQNIKKIDQGIDMIGETICNKKVLIVLDDVDDVHQIQELIGMNFLCPGTRILVTTRDKRVLNIRGFKYKIVPYEMKGLSDKDALQLFSRHAFDKNSPLADYDTLSKEIVSTTGGLPLALESIGSLLFLQKEKKIWEEKLEKLRKTHSEYVLGKLRISYDALETDQQQIFLDVACFFIGENKTNPIYMWRDCGFSPEDSIDVLISRCMITITDDNRFWMHNQFRDLGRAIATQESSRLWAADNIICELKSTEIKRSVQALCLQSDSSTQPTSTVTPEQIERFPHLRFLRFSLGTCQGNFTGCLSKLKWISVHYPGIQPSLQGQCHPPLEATNWHLENVVVANLSGLGFMDDERLLSGARKLKVLTLQGTNLQTLERLPSNLTVLEVSRTRVNVESLEGLARLEKLTVEGCELLKSLSIPSNLKKLREVKVSSCTGLVEVKFLDVLRSMEILCIEDCKSFESLENLKNLENLKCLGIKGCERLQVFTLQESYLQTLEGFPSNLTVLELSRTGVEQLPLDGLSQLEKLTVEGCELLERLSIPSSLCKLREVKVSSCTELVEVQFLDVLRSMEILCIEDCKLFESLENLKKLENLKCLGIKGCENLVLTPIDGPSSNLTVSELSRTRVKEGPLDGLAQLEKLTVEGCQLLKRLSIPSSLSKLIEVKVSSCTKLVEVQFLDVLRSMETLCIEDCESLMGLKNLDNLENLKDLGLKGCKNLLVVEGIDKLKFLQWLTVKGCGSMERIIGASCSKIPNKCEISITDCGKLPDTGRDGSSITCESYREILNCSIQGSDSKTEAGILY